MYKYVKLFLVVVFLLLTLVVTSAIAAPEKLQLNTGVNENIEWRSYTDARFDFAVEYPADWYLVPRDDSNPEAVSGILTFALIDPGDIALSEGHAYEQVANPNIVIGLYLAELAPWPIAW